MPGQARRGTGLLMAGSSDWAGKQAPSLADFEQLAAVAWRRLPKDFRDMCGSVVIRVEDFPTDDVLRTMQLQSAFDLMGLFHGVSLDKRSVMEPVSMPNMVFLYRRPMLDYWAEYPETLGDLITHVLVHEIGHHFGLSDADIALIEASAGE